VCQTEVPSLTGVGRGRVACHLHRFLQEDEVAAHA
ncbi:ABC transporter ATP-binding protein, partial [Mesorhizobium sp. M8A.F.Ca.ET.023.01.1.1]